MIKFVKSPINRNTLNPIISWTGYVFLFTFLISICFNDLAAQPVNSSMKHNLHTRSGVERITERLTQANVFRVPEYESVNNYDSFKKFPGIDGILFNGLSYKGHETKVFCWIGIPEAASRENKVGAVVLVHGGGGTVFPDWIKKWTDRGYAAISIGLEGQIPGDKVSDTEPFWPRNESSGPWRKGFFLDADEDIENQWFFHAVADVIMANSLIRSLPEVDPEKVGITGISWGGIITNVVAGIDHRFAFAIPVYGCGFLNEAPTYIKQISALSEEKKEFYLNHWEPSLYIPGHRMPTLFVNGTNDCHFPMNSFTKTWKASSAEKHLLVLYKMAHGHSPGWNPEEIYAFADYVTGRNDHYPRIKITVSKNNEVQGLLSGSLNEAFLYYTCDTTDWQCDNYQWLMKEVEVNRETGLLKITVPDSALYFFVNAVSAEGLTISSPMQRNTYQKTIK